MTVNLKMRSRKMVNLKTQIYEFSDKKTEYNEAQITVKKSSTRISKIHQNFSLRLPFDKCKHGPTINLGALIKFSGTIQTFWEI
jgi:hypothetical protein